MTALVLTPGEASLSDWRAVFEGATPRLAD